MNITYIIIGIIILLSLIFLHKYFINKAIPDVKDNKIPIKNTGVMFKLVKLKPWSVAMIFQIDKIHVRKKDEMIKNIKRDLNFIDPLSN